jgi:hypothetical protein
MVIGWIVSTHETNNSRKLLVKTWANWMVRFCQDRRQSGAPLGFNGMLLLRPSGVWMVEMREPRQLQRLKRWLRDLIDKKKRKLGKLGQKV